MYLWTGMWVPCLCAHVYARCGPTCLQAAVSKGRAQGSREGGPQNGALGGGEGFRLPLPHLPTQHHKIHATVGVGVVYVDL